MTAREMFLAAAMAAALAPAARAEAPAPLGRWVSTTSGAVFVIAGNGCSFQGQVTVVGQCDWAPTSRGGILTLFYPLPLEPGKIYYSVVWVDQNTITVEGEYFFRQ
jgi:hypothetical protein